MGGRRWHWVPDMANGGCRQCASDGDTCQGKGRVNPAKSCTPKGYSYSLRGFWSSLPVDLAEPSFPSILAVFFNHATSRL